MSDSPDWVFYRDEKLTEAEVMPRLVAAFPGFRPRWEEHLAHWKGASAGNYGDLAEFVHFVVEDLYPNGQSEDVQRVFGLMEKWLVDGSQAVRGLVVIGFLETLQNVASWQAFGKVAFIPFLGSKSREAWDDVERMWAGKSSLFEVIRAERKQGDS